MDKLPDDYSCYCRRDIAIILEPFTLEDLFNESIKCNPKAQRAFLVKVDCGLNEVQGWSMAERVDKILWFWDQIKDVNSKSDKFGLTWEYSIMSAIRETLMSYYFYRLGVEPEYSDICYAINKMEEHGLDKKRMEEIKDCYERNKPKPKEENKPKPKSNSFNTFESENKWRKKINKLFESESSSEDEIIYNKLWGPRAWQFFHNNIGKSSNKSESGSEC